jgi:hypothetical protein
MRSATTNEGSRWLLNRCAQPAVASSRSSTTRPAHPRRRVTFDRVPGAAATRMSRAPAVLLITSSALVLVAAVGFDVLADEPPVHALAVGLAALVVGVGRLWTLGRFRGMFAAVNVVVVGQPAVHALSKLTAAGADSLPHSHGWFEGLPVISLHVVVALLVVAVAAGEPACGYVVSAVVLLLARVGRAPATPVRTFVVPSDRRAQPLARERRLLLTRQAHRRGPPAGAALAS